jgi:hypothetical protein
MSPSSRRVFLLGCLLLAVLVPLAGSWLRWDGLPPGFGIFPAQRAMTPAPVDAGYYGAGLMVVALLSAFLLVPRWFGFRPAPAPPAPPTVPLPAWFWAGAATMAASWAVMWVGPEGLARYTFVPLWWGLIVALDGAVHARTGGRSFLGADRGKLVALAAVSLAGWHLFEYWNYFVLSNWYYPHAGLLSPVGSFVWYSVSFTTVWPVCIEAYLLLAAVPALRARWAAGPAIAVPRAGLAAILGLGFGLQFAMGLFPQELFWAIWVAPMLIFGAALALAGCRTPLDDLAAGDWSRGVLMALGTFLLGFVWELWNFGSHAFRAGVATNPNYWRYDVPYFGVGHLFSEMPAMGYFGYLFFGVVVWLTWLVAAHVVGMPPELEPAAAEAPAAGGFIEVNGRLQPR